MSRELRVTLHGREAGTLLQTDAGRLEFTYARPWLAAGVPLI